MKVVTVDGQGNVLWVRGEEEAPRKSIYTKSEFLDLIPAAIRQEIASENKAGTPEIMDWIFIVNAMTDVNLNPGQHPQGFVDGLNSMAANVKISLNQTQIDNFLEV